jgi:putative tricarboxylic transport membrane protein
MRALWQEWRLYLAWLVLGWASGAWAQAGSGPECVVPAKVGGGFDYTCKLTQAMLRSVQPPGEAAARISYLPGGIGAVAFDRAVKDRLADPNVLVAFSSGSLLNLVQGKFGAHPVNSVRWLVTLGTDYGVIAVRADSRISTLRDLRDELQKNPARVVFGAGGTVGSQDWIKAASLVRAAGQSHKSMRFVSFEGGGEALSALRGGHVDVYSGDASEVKALLAERPQRVKIIAILAADRLPGPWAAVPTAREQGIDLVWPTVRGLYLGPGVGDADYRRWALAFDKAMATPGFAALREGAGMFPFSLTGEAVDAFVARESARFRAMAMGLNLRVIEAR